MSGYTSDAKCNVDWDVLREEFSNNFHLHKLLIMLIFLWKFYFEGLLHVLYEQA